MYGGAGEDKLDAGPAGASSPFNYLYGQEGHDTLRGGPDVDLLYGNDGNDRMAGREGDDQLRGGNDNDILRGGLHDDLLLGESGIDALYGGPGVETTCDPGTDAGDTGGRTALAAAAPRDREHWAQPGPRSPQGDDNRGRSAC